MDERAVCIIYRPHVHHGYLLQFELITRQNHDDALVSYGKGPVDQATMVMRTVELKIESDPDLYFPRFIQALRWSNLG